MSWIEIEQEGKSYTTTFLVPQIREYNSKKTTLTQDQWLRMEERRTRRRLRNKRRRAKRTQKKHSKKDQKKQAFEKPRYEKYIVSKDWKERRDRYLNEHGHRCEACGNRNELTVHHTHYGYLGREEDIHLTALCWSCHKQFHDKYGTKSLMQEETAEFVADKKMSII